MTYGLLFVLFYVKSRLRADAGSFCALVKHERHLTFIVPEWCRDDGPHRDWI